LERTNETKIRPYRNRRSVRYRWYAHAVIPGMACWHGRGGMIILRFFINRVPDTWEPVTIWYLVAIETLLDAFVISMLIYWIRTLLSMVGEA
jgi:hypothetical protein